MALRNLLIALFLVFASSAHADELGVGSTAPATQSAQTSPETEDELGVGEAQTAEPESQSLLDYLRRLFRI